MDRLDQSSRVKRATGGGGPVAWGDITGTLADQVDLSNALSEAVVADGIDGGTAATIYNTFAGIDGGGA